MATSELVIDSIQEQSKTSIADVVGFGERVQYGRLFVSDRFFSSVDPNDPCAKTKSTAVKETRRESTAGTVVVPNCGNVFVFRPQDFSKCRCDVRRQSSDGAHNNPDSYRKIISLSIIFEHAISGFISCILRDETRPRFQPFVCE